MSAIVRESNTVEWDRAKLARFDHALSKALDTQVRTFSFEGREFDTAYAGYLIEYLETQFQMKGC